MDNFRGIRLVELEGMIREAADMGGVTLMKRVDVPETLGKWPSMVLAEMLISLANGHGDPDAGPVA